MHYSREVACALIGDMGVPMAVSSLQAYELGVRRAGLWELTVLASIYEVNLAALCGTPEEPALYHLPLPQETFYESVAVRLRFAGEVMVWSGSKVSQLTSEEGFDIFPQTINSYTSGRRTIGICELYVLATCYGLPMEWFYLPLDDSQNLRRWYKGYRHLQARRTAELAQQFPELGLE
jgi:hypothetical protein